MEKKQKGVMLRHGKIDVVAAPVAPPTFQRYVSEHDLFVTNLRYYWRNTCPLTQGQYRDGNVASFALRRDIAPAPT
jgi:hypothetical protein